MFPNPGVEHSADIEKLNAILRSADSDTEDLTDEEDELFIAESDPLLAEPPGPSKDPQQNATILDTKNMDINFTRSDLYTSQVSNILRQAPTGGIERLKTLNKAQQNLLMHVREKMVALVEACKRDLEAIRKNMTLISHERRVRNTGFNRLGAPYFKDLKWNYCTMNEDARMKRERGELMLMDLPPMKFWIDNEKTRLRQVVLEQSKAIRLKLLKEKDKGFSFKYDIGDTKLEIYDQLEENVFPRRCTNIPIDWMRIAASEFKGRHSYDECKAMWYLYLHPELNNKPFDDEEFNQLKIIAGKYRFQNWDQIAEELGNGRSGYYCFLYVQLHDIGTAQAKRWTPEDDAQLLEVISRCKIGSYIPWGKVSYYIKNRSKAQIYLRYHNTLSETLKKGKFSEREDILISALVQKLGTNFPRISSFMPGRTSTQIRSRYKLHADLKNRSKEVFRVWTVEEDKQISDHVNEHGTKAWSLLESQFQSSVPRNRTSLRHRYNIIKKYINQYNGDLSKIPRMKWKCKPKLIPQAPVKTLIRQLQKFEETDDDIILSSIMRSDSSKESLNDFKKKFISYFHFKVNFESPLMEIDLINAIFVFALIEGRINEDYDVTAYVLDAREKNVFGGFEAILNAIKLHLDDNFIDIIKKYWISRYGSTLIGNLNLEEDAQLFHIFPCRFSELESFQGLLTGMKFLMKRFAFPFTSKLDQFFTYKHGKFYFTDEYIEVDPAATGECENELPLKILELKCRDLFCNAGFSPSTEITQTCKQRLLGIFTLPAMGWLVHRLVDQWEQYDTFKKVETIKPKPSDGNENKRKRGRPRKTPLTEKEVAEGVSPIPEEPVKRKRQRKPKVPSAEQTPRVSKRLENKKQPDINPDSDVKVFVSDGSQSIAVIKKEVQVKSEKT